MRYLKCKCGNAQSWSSGYNYADCDGCKKCNTTLASGPDGHKPLAEHEFVAYPIKADQEGVTETRCKNCHKTKRNIEKENKSA